MKNDIQGSCISVAVPTELYVKLLGHLRRSTAAGAEPTTLVTAILQKYLDDAQTNPPRQSGLAPAPRWSNDWIMFGSPVAPTTVKAQGPGETFTEAQSNDWCIGCGCPSEHLLSSPAAA